MDQEHNHSSPTKSDAYVRKMTSLSAELNEANPQGERSLINATAGKSLMNKQEIRSILSLCKILAEGLLISFKGCLIILTQTRSILLCYGKLTNKFKYCGYRESHFVNWWSVGALKCIANPFTCGSVPEQDTGHLHHGLFARTHYSIWR